jgi:hypothetical protein
VAGESRVRLDQHRPWLEAGDSSQAVSWARRGALGGEYAVVAMAVSARWRDEQGQPIEQLEQLDRGQMQDGTPVGHGLGEAVDQAVVVFARPGQALLGEHRAGVVRRTDAAALTRAIESY